MDCLQWLEEVREYRRERRLRWALQGIVDAFDREVQLIEALLPASPDADAASHASRPPCADGERPKHAPMDDDAADEGRRDK